jgi:hypothetical protein
MSTFSKTHTTRFRSVLATYIEGNIVGWVDVKGRRGRRSKRLLDDIKERKGYCKLKEQALDRTLWRTRFGRVYGPCRKMD